MIIKKLEVGPIMANCFILGCESTKEAVVIDPGDDSDRILMELAKSELNVKYLINTHGHFDHVGANKRMKEVTGAKLAIHPEDEPMFKELSHSASMFGLTAQNSPPADILLKHGDEISFGEINLKVIHTPGHSKGGICLYTKGHLFSGDTLFAGSIGRTDLPGGDYDTLISSIKNNLLSLDDKTIVYTGHGPETTLGDERRSNPFLR
ncbi:MAG: MBL fold metallo-hydrolase [Desulfobacula sp.]|uniref:MBL fold metallo-hydrolase n=2 Tax=Desulfobacula sp. TaxID=2593537 RepID=UPI001D394899|nr:MBL fold metallo-hydrolase [Desulfobacula sp.]MBT3485235.1 MBL fold metallo-hydrolase [Desulfobacula sp.]MBT3804758.1 MBL fold metallo-hydrolase [Desulfobacula sp.]MBT4025236.1 MBL fold metallo-hydrolase [Desulfobacula sp.]MBT4507173.1 MBL fold metallo-hydrolase [Desulfobacula sp.]